MEKDNNKEEHVLSNYSHIQQEDLIGALSSLLRTHPVQNIRKEVSEIKRCFDVAVDKDKDKKLEEYIKNGGEKMEFHYRSADLDRFRELYKTYREKINKYHDGITAQNRKNIATKQEILKELKDLWDSEPSINKSFFDTLYSLKDRWRAVGKITDIKSSNELWQNYKHYLETLNNYLKLSNQFRDIDTKHKLEQRLKVIEKARSLLQEVSTKKAVEELEILKKIWREDIGFVSNKQGEESWREFGQISKQIYNKHKETSVILNKEYRANLELKRKLCEKMDLLVQNLESIDTHILWREKVDEFEKVVVEFDNIGMVPRSAKKEVLDRFMSSKRIFIKSRNSFYKKRNQEVKDKLASYKVLLNQVDELKDSIDWNKASNEIREIQQKWKHKGVVQSKKYYDLRDRFNRSCDHFFHRYKNRFLKNVETYQENLSQRKTLLSEMKGLTFNDDREKNIALIMSYVDRWKNMGEVLPNEREAIESKFSNVLLSCANQIGLSLEQLEHIEFEAEVKSIIEKNDTELLRNELINAQNNIVKLKKEVQQLENNLGFFVDPKPNPFKDKIQDKIERLSQKLKKWENKAKSLKNIEI